MTWRLLQMCAACPTPRLNLSSSSVPLGTTSMIRSPPGPRRIQLFLGVRCEVKTRGTCTYKEEGKVVQHHLRGNQGSRESRHRQFRVRESRPGVEVYASRRNNSGILNRLGRVFTQLIPTNAFSQFEFPKCGDQWDL